MATKKTVQSVEPNIADLANGWLKSYKLDYKLEQESLNTEIDQALYDYYSKNGGTGGNRPDAKLLLKADDGLDYPILIEYKGYEDKLIKLDAEGKIANRTSKNQPDFKNINSYAVNGAVHYANAILHYTGYTDVIAIGMTGYKNESGKDKYILLPKTNGKIDLDFMNDFISAIIKLAIKDVVMYADRKIKATKDVVENT